MLSNCDTDNIVLMGEYINEEHKITFIKSVSRQIDTIGCFEITTRRIQQK